MRSGFNSLGKGLIKMLSPLVVMSSSFAGEPEVKSSVVQEVVQDDNYWANKGKEAHSKGDVNEAEKCYRESLKTNPNNSYALSGIGVILLDNGEEFEEQAVSSLVRAVKLPGAGADEWNNLGVYYDTKRLDFQEAKACYEKAVELGGGVYPLIDLAELYSRTYIFQDTLLKGSGLTLFENLQLSREAYQRAFELSKDSKLKGSIELRIKQIDSLVSKKFPEELEKAKNNFGGK